MAYPFCRYLASTTSSIEKPYKLMRIKAKDLEKVDPDEPFGELDPSLPLHGFEESKELNDANEMVKKIFSLQLASQKQLSEKQVIILNKKVQLDPEKPNKYAKIVVSQTVLIRQLSRRLQSFQNRKDVESKVRLIHLLDKRRKILKLLRKQNFAQFEKVKKELGIEYVPAGRYDYYPTTKRMAEKKAIIKDAVVKRTAALKVYMEERREAQLLEIAQLKKELGMELTEDEQKRLDKSEEVEAAEK